MIDPDAVIDARAHRDGLMARLREIAQMDVVVALEIIEEVTADLGLLHFDQVMAMLQRKLSEKPSVCALLVKMGPECAWEVDGFLDEEGNTHPVPTVDPNVPSSYTEDRWWDQVDQYVGVLYNIPTDGRFVTEEQMPIGPRLVIRPAGRFPSSVPRPTE